MIPIFKGKDINEFVDFQFHNALIAWWNNGGKEKYEATKAQRELNGIPDKQWFAANLMGIIDDAEITLEE